MSTSNKRKAEELEAITTTAIQDTVASGAAADPADHGNVPPHLPATVWGGILDFMFYNEVRSTLLVGKLIAFEAVKHVQTLNILKVAEMDLPAARRFANVEEINIFCLFTYVSRDTDRFSFSPDAATRIVPFLTHFSKLKAAFVGGIRTFRNSLSVGQNYSADDCMGPDNHRALFCSLIDAFCVAFKMRALPKDMFLEGISNGMGECRACRWRREDPRRPCGWCRDIAATFPLASVLHNVSLCLSDTNRYHILSKRPGGLECLRSVSAQELITFLRMEIEHYNVPTITADEKSFWQKIEQERVRNPAPVRYMSNQSFAELDAMIDCWFDPRKVSRYQLYESLEIGLDNRRFDVWAKSTIDRLVSMGFPLDANDLIIVDEKKEPALLRMIHSRHYEVGGEGSGAGSSSSSSSEDSDESSSDDDYESEESGGGGYLWAF